MPGATQTAPTDSLVNNSLLNSAPTTTAATASLPLPVPTSASPNQNNPAQKPLGSSEDITSCPFVNFVSKVHANPAHILYAIYDITRQTVSWVIWNYRDFYEVLTHPVVSEGFWQSVWNTPEKLLWLGHVIWRGLVVTGITLGLVNAGPFLLAMYEWFGLFLRFLWEAFSLTEQAVQTLWRVIEDIIEDIRYLVGW